MLQRTICHRFHLYLYNANYCLHFSQFLRAPVGVYAVLASTLAVFALSVCVAVFITARTVFLHNSVFHFFYLALAALANALEYTVRSECRKRTYAGRKIRHTPFLSVLIKHTSPKKYIGGAAAQGAFSNASATFL